MIFIESLKHYIFLYHGTDWLIMLTVFFGVFLLGNKRKLGFIFGMISSAFGLLFSFQIGSIANGISSSFLFVLYLRGYLEWIR